MDDAATEFLGSLKAVEKQRNMTVGAPDGVDLAAMRNCYAKDFIEYFNKFKVGVGTL
jgi:hypothetical protein